jgi:hypothetical protein
MEMRKRTNKKDLPYEYRRILSLLRKGKENTIIVKEIIQLTGYKDQFIRKCVSDLVNKHWWPVGTSNDYGSLGYYLMTKEDERESTYKNFRSRAKHIFKRSRVIKNVELIDESEDLMDDVI